MRKCAIYFIIFWWSAVVFSYKAEARVELIFLCQRIPEIALFAGQFQKSLRITPLAFSTKTYRLALVAWERDGIPYATTYFCFLGEYIPLYETEEGDFESREKIKLAARQMAVYSAFEAQMMSILGDEFVPGRPWRKEWRQR